MYYIKIENGTAVGYPMTEQSVRELNPSVSLPLEIDPAELLTLGYAPYQRTVPPQTSRYETAAEITPTFDGTIAMQTFEVRAMSEQEKSVIDAAALAEVRLIQRTLLSDCDWTEMPSVQSKHTQEWIDAWAAYRTAVRDVDKQESWPFDIEWPKVPTVAN